MVCFRYAPCFLLLLIVTGTALAAPAPDLSARTIAIASNGIPRSRRAIVRAVEASLAPSFGGVITSGAFRKTSRSRKAAVLRKAARKLGADYVIALTAKKDEDPAEISIRLLDVASPALTRWTVPLESNESELARAGQEISQRIVTLLGGDVEPEAPVEDQPETSNHSMSTATVERDVVTAPIEDAFAIDDAFAAMRGELAETSDLTAVEPETSGPLYSSDDLTISVEAKLKTDLQFYFTNDPRFVGENKINRRLAADLLAGAKLQSRYLAANAGILVRRDLGDPARNRLEPGELTLALKLPPLQLRAGHTVITWGRATLYSVVDVLDPVDARDFLVREKLPVWAANAGVTAGPIHADVYFLPFFRADIVDIPRGVAASGGIDSPNRWIVGAFPVASQNNVPVNYIFDPGQSANKLVAAPQLAARLATSIAGIDLAAGYVNHIDPFPSVRSSVRSSAEEIDVASEVDYHRRQIFTLDGELTIDRVHFIAEAMLALPQTKAVENNGGTLPYIAGTIGADYRSPRLFDDHELRLFVEATMTRALAGELPNDPSDPSVAITRGRFPFPLAVMARAGYSFGENVTLGVLGVANLGQIVFAQPGAKKELDLYLRPEVQVALFHRVQAVVGVDLLAGGQAQFFGSFKQNARLTAGLQVSYDY